jgi:hypothetical protein
MKKSLSILIFLTICMFFVSSCEKDNNNSKIQILYAGDYSGFMEDDSSYVGVWTAIVNAEEIITISAIVNGELNTLSGTVSSDGSFSVSEIGGSRTGQGSIDNKGNISGTWGEQAGVIGDLGGGLDLNNIGASYTGSWYENDNGTYSQMTITTTTYALKQDDNNDGTYDTAIEDGTFTTNGNDVLKDATFGKYYIVSDNTLILAITGQATISYEKTDSNPN